MKMVKIKFNFILLLLKRNEIVLFYKSNPQLFLILKNIRFGQKYPYTFFYFFLKHM